LGFVCTLASGIVPIVVVTSRGRAAATFDVGYFDDRPLDLKAVVALEGTPEPDLTVQLIAVDVERSSEVATFLSGRTTRRFISSREDRAAILNAILAAVHSVVDTIRPERIHRETQDDDLPDRALRKHLLIEGVIRMSGYSVVEEGLTGGAHVWVLERTGAVPVALMPLES